MHITQAKFKNYKSFYDPRPLVLDTGFNVVTGQNNIGKTALLELLKLSFTNKPHSSTRTQPTPTTALLGRSVALFTIEATGEEVRSILTAPGSNIRVPVPVAVGGIASGVPEEIYKEASERDKILIEWILDRPTLQFEFEMLPDFTIVQS